MTPNLTTHPLPVAARATERVKVLFAAGAARSGTTLLDRLLGEVPGFAAVGELRYLWERGLVEQRLCGCGVPVASCSFWDEVLDRSLGARSDLSTSRIITELASLQQPRTIAGLLRPTPRTSTARTFESTIVALDALYSGIRDATGASVIVDSSKPPTFGALLEMVPSVDVYVVHLVRDPRACAFSLQRKKVATDRPDAALMRRQPTWKAALTWDLWNVAAETVARRQGIQAMQTRYEDLIEQPDREVRRILRLVGADQRSMPWIDGTRPIHLGVNHTVAGNPSRLDRTVDLRLDDEWTRNMEAGDRRAVVALTSPLLSHYRYRYRHTPAAAPQWSAAD